MKIRFAYAAPYFPQVMGGVNVNTHELACELVRRGHDVSVLVRLGLSNAFGLRRTAQMLWRRQRVTVDASNGYLIYRARRPWEVADSLPPCDVAVIQDGYMQPVARALSATGVPAVAYFHGLEFESASAGWGVADATMPFGGFIANSMFTASRFETRFGIRPVVIPPIFVPERYRSQGDRRYVTFINPVSEKGVDLALELAGQCPDIAFLFVKGWPLSPRDWLRLTTRVRRLPNVRLTERRSDMTGIYGATRILLVPSQWKAETWGRVASEAQCSGIPVLASNVGGLPESVGPGGRILERTAPASAWAAELRRMWSEPEFYSALSAAALRHAQRPEIELDHQVGRFVSTLEAARSRV